MEVTANKTPNKRKSMGGQNKTPAKTPKLENEAKTPKSAKKNKSPKAEAKTPVPANKTPAKSDVKTPKTEANSANKPKAVQEKKQSPKKLQKFEGTKQLQAKTTDKKKKGKSYMNHLLEKLQEDVAKDGKEAVIKKLNEKIDSITARPEITTTGKRKLQVYKRCINIISGEKPAAKQNGKEAPKPKQNAPAKNAKQQQKPKKVEEEKDDDDEEDDDEMGSEEESGDDENDDNDDDESADEEEVQDKKQNQKVISKQKSDNKDENKKKRYVLFVGNIAYDTTKQELEEHFKKAGEIKDVRIPLEKETNRPRGFAYVEVSDEEAYQKAFNMNGSQLKNRKLKVEYTQAGGKMNDNKKKDVKAKNLKLKAMQKKGQFGKKPKGSAKVKA